MIAALEVGLMPPQGTAQPSEVERRRMLETLGDAIDDFDYSEVDDPGFEPMRRLTHTEYDHTLRDLFGVDLDPAERFPEELSGASGFDNSANTLFLQSALMERYIATAERVVDLALPASAKRSTPAHRRAHDRIFAAAAGGSGDGAGAAEQVVARFLSRAYRRPPHEAELGRALDHYSRARSEGQDFEEAIKQVLASVLISPKFLLRVEAGRDGDQPFRIGDYELASRLSYFLWASMPDDELFDLAARNELHEPDVLLQQVDRMLADPKADTLGYVFAAQWLGFNHVGTRIWLDPIDNPWCTATLMTAMRDESALFFLSLLRDNLPIRRLIDADYTFLNEELATALYAMEGIQDAEMRRVKLDDPNRGGIIGHGSILAVTSNYKDTSPVKRGNYILETLLGTPPPPPPPPPNAGVLDEDVQKLKEMSFREKLERHSRDETCRVCHSRIDPLGFSLENFDFFGRWRDSYHFRSRVEDPAEADEVAVVEDVDAFAETASEGERRFINAMVLARANGGAGFAVAVPKLEALGSDYPNERLVQMILGQIHQAAGNADKARSAFERALEIGPSSSRARSFIANDNLLQGKYSQARASFEAIEKVLPKGSAPAPIRYGVAFSYLYEGKDKASLGALDTFLNEYRDSGQTQTFPEVFIWNSIARIHLENGRAEEAMTAYVKGYQSVPESGIPEDQKQVWYGRLKHGRARTFAKLGRFDEAREEAKAIHKMIEDGGETAEQYLPAYHYLVGYLELEAGNAQKAVKHLKQSNPNDPFHKLLLARALDRVGERESALKAYQDIVDSNINGLERALAYPEAKQQLKKG